MGEYNDPIVSRVIGRLHRLALVPELDAEALHLRRYAMGDSEEFHLDTDMKEDLRRPLTAMIYLNDAQGGETVFPHVDGYSQGSPSCKSVEECCNLQQGLRIQPLLGRVIFFHSE